MTTQSKHAGPKARSVRRLTLCALAVPILFLAQAAAPARTATGPSGLVAAYGFDAGSGTTVTDQSGNGNNGTVTNTTWAATGKFGKALQFNGTSSLVTVPDAASLHLTTAMTLEAWVNPSTVNGSWRDVIYKGNDNYYLEGTSTNGSKPDGGLIAGGSYADAYGTAALPANTWSYLAETYDGATLRLYVNGTQVASTAHTGAISTSANPLQIGGDSLYGQFFAGMIDEVRVYNTALTAAQIQTDQTTPISPTGPTYSVGGSVSGLSGSVVLRDNGGDDLSVSANGPFTFATQLASGASYAVTVKTNPAGQTCSVSNGSGTIGSANVTGVAVACVSTPPQTYSVGGSVSGLSGSLVLRDNGGDDLSVSANGPFTFATQLAGGAAYSVTVKTNPSGQTCSVSNGSGTIGSANVTGVAVACVSTPPVRYSVGGSVSGLSGTVVLQDNGGDDLSVSANGPFTFATQLVGGAAYSVTVKTNPSGQTCTVANGSGTIGSANVTGVAVTCSASSGSGSSVSDNFNRANGGLGAGWTAVSDGGLVISSQVVLGSSATAGDIRTGESYAGDQSSQVEVTSTQLSGGQWIGPAVRMQAGGQNMYLGIYFWNNGAQQLRLYKRSAGNWVQLGSSFNCGALAAGTQLQLTAVGSTISFLQNGVTRISVTDGSVTGGAPGIMTFGTAKADNWVGGGAGSPPPPPQTYSVGGSVSGLSGTVVLQDNGGDNLSVSANGPFTFATQLASGAAYAVTVKTNPSGQTCSVSGGSGTVGSANVTSVAVACSTTPTYSIGGSVSGSAGTVVLQDNGGDDLSITSNGPFNFATSLASGAAYAVTVKTNPSGQTCSVSGGSGTVGSSSVTNVTVTCTTTPTYSVGGSVSGLAGTVVLQDNGGDDLSVSANGPFTFATALASGSVYGVTVKSNPTAQTCTVSGGTGTVGSANITTVAVACSDTTVSTGSDDFNRANGGLGPNWAAVSDGGLSISSQAVLGSSATAGDIRVGETYPGDQSSQIEVTSTQLTGGQWIGPAVRMQGGGQNMYLGIYFWNNGNQQLQLYKRSAGTWIQLGSSSNSGALAAGTQLQLTAVGSTISFLVNGVTRISVTDSSIAGGAPGIMTFGTATGDNWVGATATASTVPTFQITYTGTDANGVASYSVVSADNGYGTQVVRVLSPTNPTPGVPHNFLYALPVEGGLASDYGDGIDTLRALDAQDQYNLTIIAPTFEVDPWYADNPTDPNLQYETFLTKDLVPWVTKNLSTSGHEQNWLIGFSKSGIGAEDLLLKHPDIFSLAASWDFPADMTSYDEFGSSSANEYGTDANFQANYRLTPAFLNAHKAPFVSQNRIWIGGYSAFQTDMSDYDALLTSDGILHTTETPTVMVHRWDSGWVPTALAALHQDSANLP